MTLDRKRVEQYVIATVARLSGRRADSLSLATDVVNELGMAGDDGFDLIKELNRNFGTDFSQLNFRNSFGSERAGAFSLVSLAVAILGRAKREAIPISRLVDAIMAGRWN